MGCSEEKHKSICPLGALQWWTEEIGKVWGGEEQDVVDSVGEEQGVVVDKMTRCQPQWLNTGDKEREMGKEQVEDNCIKTLKVRKVVRVAGCGNAQLRPRDDCKEQQKPGKRLEKGGVENTFEQEEVSGGQVHSVTIEVRACEATGIIGLAGKNVRRLNNMTGTWIHVKGGVNASTNIVEIRGDKKAVEKATEHVNEYLMKNCTIKVSITQHELKALTGNGRKFLKQFQMNSNATILFVKQSSSTVLFVVGPREAAEKLKEELDEFFGSVQHVLLLTQTEKQILLDGGKSCPLKDFSNQVDAVFIFKTSKDLQLNIYGSEKARRKAATIVKEYLSSKTAPK